MKLAWRARELPLTPGALFAPRATLAALTRRLDDARLSRLRGVSAAPGWILLGEAEDLPWADGVVYLARDPAARALYVPTYAELVCSAALVERAIARRFEASSPPWALFEHHVVSLREARSLDRERMAEELA